MAGSSRRPRAALAAAALLLALAPPVVRCAAAPAAGRAPLLPYVRIAAVVADDLGPALGASTGAAVADDLGPALGGSTGAAVVVVVPRSDGSRPARRAPGAALLTFEPAAAAAVPAAVQRALAAGLERVEALRGRRLFPLTLDALGAPADPPAADARRPGRAAPLAVFDAAAGRLLLAPAALRALRATPAPALVALVRACERAAQHLVDALAEGAPATRVGQLVGLVAAAAAAGAAFVLPAGAGAVPRWWCFACPAVLGLLAPLAINAAVGAAASEACRALDLDDAECVDLWLGALFVGMVLSLLSAVPIFKVCRLAECAHANATTPLAAA
ncbi:hypothetical protein HT031_000502 [Scenedesmus sp. PABB004]|nr:hypothetical protein HT031_000502 [Scenedesmus sp. PABB004]